METSYRPLLLITLATAAFAIAIASYKALDRRKKEFKHLAELHASLGLIAFASFLFRSNHEGLVALNLLPWAWVIWTWGRVFEDLTGRKMLKIIHLYLIDRKSVV